MVKLNFSLLILIYLFPWLVILGYFWVRNESRKKMRFLPPSPSLTTRCPICTHVYLSSPQGEYSYCPRCGSLNLKGPSAED